MVAVGTKVDSLFIEGELGRGAYGVVYRARDTLIGRPVALKVIPGGTDLDADARQRMLAEARLVGRLTSPHIVTLYRLRERADGGWMLEMELVDGGSLEDEFVEGQPVAIPRFLRIARGVLAALESAHAARVLHGDIKPANVLFTRDGEAKLADFGLGRIIDATKVSVELKGESFGTPIYMAPEVMSGESAAMSCDIWSAGVLFHQLLTGHLPYTFAGVGELFAKLMSEDPEPLPESFPENVRRLVAACLVRDPAGRATAADLLRELALPAEVAAPVAETNLRDDPTSFVGREDDVERVAALVRDARVTSIHGPGGIGKTRLARAVGREIAAEMPGGCWYADLSEVTDAIGFVQHVASALGARLTGDADGFQELADLMRVRPPLLLIVDNVEQILEDASRAVALWVQHAPDVRVLVTTRALLGIGGERAYELAPLAIPADEVTSADAAAVAGVALFVERAREADAAFVLDDGNVEDVARIVRELEGMPLALELAAARVRILKPAQMAQRLERKFQLLRSGRRDLTARQSTLTGAIAWSFDLLSDWEKSAYLQACVFRDGFTLEAAEEILDLDSFPDAPFAMDAVQSLRDKSLLTAGDVGLETRLGMYRSIQEYGRERFEREAAPDERAALFDRHANYYAAVVARESREIPGPRDRDALDVLEIESPNALAAAEQLDPDGAARVVLGLADMMRIRRTARELEPLLESIGPLGDETLEAERLLHLSWTKMTRGDREEAMTVVDRAIELAGGDRARRQRGDLRRLAGDLDGALADFTASDEPGGRGTVLWQRGDLDGAHREWLAAETAALKSDDTVTAIRYRSNLGTFHERRGESAEALACYRTAEDRARRLGDRLWTAVCVSNSANALFQLGRTDEAINAYAEAEKLARVVGDRSMIAEVVGFRADAHVHRGDADAAIECYEEAEEIATQLNERRTIGSLRRRRAAAYARQERWDEATDSLVGARAIAEEIGDRVLLAAVICRMGDVDAMRGDVESAAAHFREGVALYDLIGANRNAWYIHAKARLANATASLGDEEQARALARSTLALADELGIGDPVTVKALAGLRALTEPFFSDEE